MAATLTHTCDRCAQPIDPRTRVEIAPADVAYTAVRTSWRKAPFDLCAGCGAALREFLKLPPLRPTTLLASVLPGGPLDPRATA